MKGPKGQDPTLASLVQRQDGQAVVAVLILVVVAALLLTPFLGQLASALRKGGNEREQRMKVYAAEAALNRTIADLIRGADGVNTTYTTTEPNTGGWFQTYTITTSYTVPVITVNGYTPTVTLALPTASQAKPTNQQSYVDPGLTHNNLATQAPGRGYLMRLYNVKAGTLQVNWAYSPAGPAELKIWAGIPASGGAPIPVGLLTSSISVNPTLDTKSATANDTFVRSAPLLVNPATDGSGGVYTIMLFNKDSNATKTTAAFVPSGGASDTWIYVQARKDYIVTASVGGVSVSAYVRQVPGFNEPPAVAGVSPNFTYTFATNNVSFITSEVSVYTWNSP